MLRVVVNVVVNDGDSSGGVFCFLFVCLFGLFCFVCFVLFAAVVIAVLVVVVRVCAPVLISLCCKKQGLL